MKGLERYFKVIETVVSSHPEIAALVWGGMKFVIEARCKDGLPVVHLCQGLAQPHL
jgi:hypothetical protein